MKKRILAIILTTVALIGVSVFSAFAEETVEKSGTYSTFSWAIIKDDSGKFQLKVDSSTPAGVKQLSKFDSAITTHTYSKVLFGSNVNELGVNTFFNMKNTAESAQIYILGDPALPSGNKFLVKQEEESYEVDHCVGQKFTGYVQYCPGGPSRPETCGEPEPRYETVYGDQAYCEDGYTTTETRTINTYSTVPEDHFIRIELLSVTASYTGEAITEKMYADKKDFVIHAHYNTKDVDYPGTSSFITFGSLRINNIGEGQTVYFHFVDPETGNAVDGTVNVPCKPKEAKSITASYTGPEVIEGLVFTPASVKVAVAYNNGDSEYFRGSAENVGIYKNNTWTFAQRGDLTGNHVLNLFDDTMLKQAVAGAITLTSEQMTQADINKDGLIDANDITALEKIIDRTCLKVGDNAFYASISSLIQPNGTAPWFARFTVPAVRRTPASVEIYALPHRVRYVQNEDLDPDGMILRVRYNNGTEELVPVLGIYNPATVRVGDADHPVTNMSTTQMEIPVYYTENNKTVKTSFTIGVSSHILTSIKVAEPPTTVVYYDGENFRPAGMQIEAYFDEGASTVVTKEDVPVAECVLSNNKKLPDSTNCVIVEMDDFTDPVEKYVSVPLGKVTSGPDSVEIGTHGTWNYNENGSRSVTGKIVGNYLIRITYTYQGTSKYTYLPITVNKARLSGLDILSEPVKKNYVAGQNFDPTGMVLRASYTNGTSAYIYYDEDGSGDGYTIFNGNDLPTGTVDVQARYIENGFMEYVDITVTVEDAAIDSIAALYEGKNIYVGSAFADKNVSIIVNYTDGHTEVTDGTHATIVPVTASGEVLATTAKNNIIYNKGENEFGAIYSGKTAKFSVTGLEAYRPIDFSSSVAGGRSYYSTWQEEFTTTKVRTVADFIRGNVSRGSGARDTDRISGTLSDREYHVVNSKSVEEDRTELTYEAGTGRPFDRNAVYASPLFSFLKESDLPAMENAISIEYRGRTEGYLFPDSSNAELANNDANRSTPGYTAPTGYIGRFGQDQSQYSSGETVAGGTGWSDWVTNGDSIGTVNAERLYDGYSVSGRNVTELDTRLSAISIRLKNAPESAGLAITAENTSGASASYTQGDIISAPARIKLELTGTVDGTPFGDLYKVFYRASSSDAQNWSSAGEWAGSAGQLMETLEIKLMMKSVAFDGTNASTSPVLTSQPKSISRVIGDNVRFAVTASGNEDNLSYQWYCNNNPISGATGAVYEIDQIGADNDGQAYFCRVTMISSGQSTDSDVAILTVSDSVPIIVTDLTDVTVDLNGDKSVPASFVVKARCKSLDRLSFMWQTSEDGITWQNVPADSSPVNGTENTLPVKVSTYTRQVNAASKPVYVRCTVSNQAGETTTGRARIIMNAEPGLDIQFSEGVVSGDTVRIGQSQRSVTARAVVTDYRGDVSYNWYVNGTYKGSDERYVFTPGTAGSFTIRCVASCGTKEAEKTMTLNVVAPPTITHNSTQSHSTSGYTVVLKASCSDPSADLKWYYDGSDVDTMLGSVLSLSGDRKTLTLSGLPDLAHVVVVKATDRYGNSTSYTFNLPDL